MGLGANMKGRRLNWSRYVGGSGWFDRDDNGLRCGCVADAGRAVQWDQHVGLWKIRGGASTWNVVGDGQEQPGFAFLS